MFCSYCGNKLSDDARFCSYCGKGVVNVTKPVQSPVNLPVSEEPPAVQSVETVAPTEALNEIYQEQTAAVETQPEPPVYTEPTAEQADIQSDEDTIEQPISVDWITADDTGSDEEDSVSEDNSAFTQETEEAILQAKSPEQPVESAFLPPQTPAPQPEFAAAQTQAFEQRTAFIPPQPQSAQQAEFIPVQPQSPERKYTLTHLLMCLASTAVFAIAAGVFAGLYFSGI
ncbi:MAG: zinc-ribbon domain-containing protein [Oscillospiraceae bacterium]|nr:zinc-ribbon domain-containing protein [Oscillospiraceae bacterium]